MEQLLELGLDTFGDVTEGAHGALVSYAQVIRDVVDEAVLADELGVDFVGVGEHYAGMVGDLYRTEPSFRRYLDAGQALLSEFSGIDVVAPLAAGRAAVAGGLASLMGRGPVAAPGPLSSTAIAQPAVFLADSVGPVIVVGV